MKQYSIIPTFSVSDKEGFVRGCTQLPYKCASINR